MLDQVGLEPRSSHLSSQLSGGECQRAAIARALYNQPEILLADEPTGNLDTGNSAQVMQIIRSINRSGLTVIMVTHDANLVRDTDLVFQLKDGRLT